ncbi:ABC transporter permease subunit [Vibrio cincinnatiensis]|uniref:ABC transporter permease subunit n=1 Tax=Vibrio cincinnatiensis TaxID=675 RepID=UPI001EDC9D79|nr:ABC transporter permease subunit [Vibrio cincinnatiensis]MCG3735362.1 ABC transporter permease subunit [Vibrio cincinnatiensis]
MAYVEFSLQERDRKRLIKDRMIRFAVTCGGVSVLGALILIFVYLALVALPLFGDAQLHSKFAQQALPEVEPKILAIDDYGEHLFVVTKQGDIQFWPVNQQEAFPIWSQSLPFTPTWLIKGNPQDGWFLAINRQHQATVLRPIFDHTIGKEGRVFSPKLERWPLSENITIAPVEQNIHLLSFAVTQTNLYFASYLDDGRVVIRWVSKGSNRVEESVLAQRYAQLDQLLMTPDGKTLYLRQGERLSVVQQDGKGYLLREDVDLSQGHAALSVSEITLLSGAYSLLVTYDNGQVSQWFDVLEKGQRSFTAIRHFRLAPHIQLLLPDTHRKGFYTFYPNGTVQSHYTTSEKLVLFERVLAQAPSMAVMSDNERYLAMLSQGIVNIAEVNNPHPEVSLSSLWRKVWYESYPEPQFVWQSTSADNDFEAKFSIVPIAFGTLKAAFYAMFFAVPIAVLAAIYTAYFMAPSMRRVVKPTIELMEALPTVIIGFLAGLWLAPIVESHLTSVVVLLIGLPLSTIVFGVIWSWLPKRMVGRGVVKWHALVLIPLLLGIMVVTLSYSRELEQIFFAGDILLYLQERGIGFDQRNALVVGMAMGFAVIPTIFTIAEDAIFSVPKHLSDGSLALGATAWQTLLRVVLLTASPGIFSAVMMGLGRAVGETMIVLMATGNTPILDWNILEGMRTLSANIAVELPESEVASSHYRILFLSALLLFLFTFVVNSLAEWVRQRLRTRYRSL